MKEIVLLDNDFESSQRRYFLKTLPEHFYISIADFKVIKEDYNASLVDASFSASSLFDLDSIYIIFNGDEYIEWKKKILLTHGFQRNKRLLVSMN